MRILIVEDDLQISNNIKEILSLNNYLTDCVFDGESALYKIETEEYDVIILDWMLPKITGIEICKRVRDKGFSVPILILTAKSLIEDKVNGLNSGADDYLTKPFISEELVARLKSLIRRKNGASSSPVITISDLQIDTNLCRVQRRGKVINLTPKEYSLLEYLILNKGKVLGRMEILEHVWGESIDPFSNTIDVHIRYLRKKIDLKNRKKLIITVKGKGYIACID